MFEEAIGQIYERNMVKVEKTGYCGWGYDDPFFRRLIRKRARRESGFINDRGFRHIKNRDDFSGVTYAFWIIRK